MENTINSFKITLSLLSNLSEKDKKIFYNITGIDCLKIYNFDEVNLNNENYFKKINDECENSYNRQYYVISIFAKKYVTNTKEFIDFINKNNYCTRYINSGTFKLCDSCKKNYKTLTQTSK